MNYLSRHRRLGLVLALVVALAAALHARDQEAAREEIATPTRGGVPIASRPQSAPRFEQLPKFDTERLERIAERRRVQPMTTDPFETALAESKPPASKPNGNSPAAPPPPPQAPPLPFRFIGAQVDSGEYVVFLEQQNRTHIARIGETINEEWRLDRLTERSLMLTYVPLGQQRVLAIGGIN